MEEGSGELAQQLIAMTVLPENSSQPSATPVAGAAMPSSVLYRHQAHMCGTGMQANTQTHKVKIKNTPKRQKKKTVDEERQRQG